MRGEDGLIVDVPGSIQLKVGETYTLRLEGLGTAGYEWQHTLEGDSGVVQVSARSAPPPPRPAPGEPPPAAYSLDDWVEVQALGPGTATLGLVQRRSWERDQPPRREHTIVISVQT